MSAFSDAVKFRCLLTGESPRYLLNPNADAPDPQVPIPVAGGEQAILEARVMRALLGPRGSVAHPLGVSHIRLTRHGSEVVVHVDAPASDGRAALDHGMAQNLLPVRTSDGQAMGVAGLRVLRNQGQDLVVGMASSSARLTLRARAPWRPWFARWRQELLANNAVPLWDSGTSTAEEWSSVQYEDDQVAWLGSGLLRRIGFFHRVGRAYWVQGSVADGRWRIEMSVHPVVGPDHDAFVVPLIDPVHGLPLMVDSRSCTCDSKPSGKPSADRECRLELRSRDSQLPGCLQLTFRMSAPPAKLIAPGADRRWLRRAGLR